MNVSGGKSTTSFPEPLGDEAYCGLIGDIADKIEPETEADISLIIIGTLVAFGNWIGRRPYVQVEATRHYTNEFALFVGQSSKGRKGTGWDRVRALFKAADNEGNRNDDWSARIKGGLSSGEGVISQFVGHNKEEPQEIVDKRLMIVEPEFARTLVACERSGSTLNAIIRDAWDQGRLATLTKQPMEVDDAHVAIAAHITAEELRRRLNPTDAANGFANRFLFVAVRRSKLLPHGGDLIDLGPLAQKLNAAKMRAQDIERMTWTSKAKKRWEVAYAELSQDRGGLLGGVTNRAEAHVLRLAMIYALINGADKIASHHLEAALEVWRYCEESARCVFGDNLGNEIADKIEGALKTSNGLTRSQISQLFAKNKTQEEIGAALALLANHGRAQKQVVSSGSGRPAEHWFSTK
jgi:hypothetical protein